MKISRAQPKRGTWREERYVQRGGLIPGKGLVCACRQPLQILEVKKSNFRLTWTSSQSWGRHQHCWSIRENIRENMREDDPRHRSEVLHLREPRVENLFFGAMHC